MINRIENLYYKLVLSLRSESHCSDLSPTKPILQKPSHTSMMTPRRQATIGTSSKGKSIKVVGSAVFPPTGGQPLRHWGHRLLITKRSHHWRPIPTTMRGSVSLDALRD